MLCLTFVAKVPLQNLSLIRCLCLQYIILMFLFYPWLTGVARNFDWEGPKIEKSCDVKCRFSVSLFGDAFRCCYSVT